MTKRQLAASHITARTRQAVRGDGGDQQVGGIGKRQLLRLDVGDQRIGGGEKCRQRVTIRGVLEIEGHASFARVAV